MSLFRIAAFAAIFAAVFPAAAAARLEDSSSVADGAAFIKVPELDSGFRFLYEQKFPQARTTFLDWEKDHPDDPFGHVAVAASYLFEELDAQRVLTSEFFLNDKKFLRGIEGKPDAARMKGFYGALQRARDTARARLRENPGDPEALFALTLVSGMQADALSILERKQLDSLHHIREAEATAKKLLAQRPDANDAWLALGAANYIIGCVSGAKRVFLWFGGVHGDRRLGMEQLGKTATHGRYLQPFAKIMLALAARREKQDDLARKLLRELSDEFPESPLYAAEYARAMGRPIPAEMRR